MGKSLYSLMLNDEVIEAVDRMAHRQNMTRSAFVNKVLAEYASVLTPEQRINDIFGYMESLFESAGDIVPQIATNQQTMALKSSLDYKYRPTVRYEVELFGVPDRSTGKISVIFRTRSEYLLEEIIDFFKLWKNLEDAYLPEVKGKNDAEYELYDNKFVRSISLPAHGQHTADSIAEDISSYINMFDALMKGYIAGNLTTSETEKEYVSYLRKGIGLI